MYTNLIQIKTKCATNLKIKFLTALHHIFRFRRNFNIYKLIRILCTPATMVTDNTSKNKTTFTISIEVKEGVTTGDSAILCELTNPDGSMAKLPEIIDFAEGHQLTVITIEDIIQYRRKYDI